jgi:hypothetical protein
MEAGPRMHQRKYIPAMEAGPRMPQRKYMQRMICSGELQIMLMKRTRSMNFCVSTAIRLVVSPTEEKRSCIPDNISPVDTTKTIYFCIYKKFCYWKLHFLSFCAKLLLGERYIMVFCLVKVKDLDYNYFLMITQ